MMLISKRRYYCNCFITLLFVGVLVFVSAPIFNKLLWHITIIDSICRHAILTEMILILTVIGIIITVNKGFRRTLCKWQLLSCIEKNLISVGAYNKQENKVYVELPKIKIGDGIIRVQLKNLRIRTVIEKYLDSFSTALPDRYIVEDYYISQNNAEIVIVYEDIKNYEPEQYSLANYKRKMESTDLLSLYFDKKHIVSLRDYPHFLISGASGSGKSYLANQLVIQAIIKSWDVVILDIKRSYGLYKAYTDYQYEPDDIIAKLQEIESQMYQRMKALQPALDKNPNVLAVDVGYKPMLVVLEEYISLQSALEKKKREELERVVKNLSVLARQSSIHLLMVMQSAGTENINATTRSNLTKVLLGNAQSNILTATFGVGADVPSVHMNRGQGLIQLDRITMLRVPEIEDIESFKEVLC